MKMAGVSLKPYREPQINNSAVQVYSADFYWVPYISKLQYLNDNSRFINTATDLLNPVTNLLYPASYIQIMCQIYKSWVRYINSELGI